MWSRVQLKDNAKSVLRQNYWVSFGAALIPSIISSILSGWLSTMMGLTTLTTSYSYTYGGQTQYSSSQAAGGVSIIGLIIMIAIMAFVVGPLTVGTAQFFIRAAQGDAQIRYLFFAFQSKSYLNIVLGMFMMNLIVGVGTILFVIPGIIFGYQYYVVPYILAENPDMSWKEALALSKNLTNGQKWNIFVLNLSFFGWIILGSIACGIGVFFVEPYIQATDTQLFFALTGRGNQFRGPDAGGFQQNQFAPGQPPVYQNQPPVQNFGGQQATGFPNQPAAPNYGAQPTAPAMPNYEAQPPVAPNPPVAPTQPTVPNYGAEPSVKEDDMPNNPLV